MVNLQKSELEESSAQNPLAIKIKAHLASINLIEVMITFLIIVTLVAVATPIFLSQKRLAEEQVRKMQGSSCQLAAQRGETLPESCPR